MTSTPAAATSGSTASTAGIATPSRRPDRRFDRAARVTAAATANQAITSVPGGQGSSAIFTAIEGEFGWTRDVVAGVASFGRLGSTLTGPLEGWLTDRVGPDRMLLAGMLFGGAALVLFSRIQDQAAYYAAFLLMSIGFSVGGFTPAMTAVNKWVSTRRRATAMAVVFGGQSVASFLVPLMAWAFIEFGWRTTLAGVGATIMAASVPVYLAMRGRPGQEEADASRIAPTERDFTVGQAVRTQAFWAISVSHMFVNLSNAAVSAHLLLHLTGQGLSLPQASSVLPVMGLTGFFAQFAGGMIGDRIDKRVPAFCAMLVQAAAVFMLAFSATFVTAALFAALWGIGTGLRFPVLHAMRGEYFGRRHYATILGLSSLPLAIGMSIAPWAVGRIYVAQGTYLWAFAGLALACVAGAVTVLFAKRPAGPVLTASQTA